MSLQLPLGCAVSPAHTSACFIALAELGHPAALEIVADSETIAYQWVVAERGVASLLPALSAALLDVKAEITPNFLEAALQGHRGQPVGFKAVDFGLLQAPYLPLPLFPARLERSTPDPLSALVGVLASLEAGEVAALQLLVEPARAPWGASLRSVVSQFDKRLVKEGDLQKRLEAKLCGPLWVGALRVAAVSFNEGGRALEICQRLGAALPCNLQAGRDELSNALFALDDAHYGDADHLRDVLERRSRRTGMLLVEGELACQWHLPLESLSHPKLRRFDSSLRPLPPELASATDALFRPYAWYFG